MSVLLLDLFVQQKSSLITYSSDANESSDYIGIAYPFTPRSGKFLFHQHFTWDLVAYFVKLCILVFSLFAFVYARDAIKRLHIHSGEYYLLGLFSILGMLVLTSANSLLSLYLGLELLSFPLYAMVALQRQSSQGPKNSDEVFYFRCVGIWFVFVWSFVAVWRYAFPNLPTIHQALLAGATIQSTT